MIRLFRLLQLIIWMIVITACTGGAMVPVTDLTAPKGRYSARIVGEGDTLYMIAWEAGLDYRALAEWNQLREPFLMTVGQRLRLTEPRNFDKVKPGKARIVVTASKVGKVSGSSLNISKVNPKNEVSNANNGANADQRGWTSQWSWPADGEVIQGFTGTQGSNGIDIAGQDGNPIRASAAGKVVYAGSGLRGYGKLLILQHDEVFLSAYAHNRRILVEEGRLVKRGQTIAEMGDTDASSPRLHFEIRLNGKPVDPLGYLPDRK